MRVINHYRTAVSAAALFSTVATGALMAFPAGAQTGDQAQAQAAAPSEEIVVTATRREEKLQKVPIAVTAVSAEMLRTQGIQSLQDLGTGKIPGLSAISMFGQETSTSFAIRGLAPDDPSQGTRDAPVALYVDGINLPRNQGSSLDLITPERVEVLRGPQGQLFGRNAEGGVVQIVSKKPTGQLDGDVSFGIGNFDTHYGKGMIDLPDLDGWDIQISGSGREHGGYIKNVRNPALEGITPIVSPGSRIVLPRDNYDTDFSKLDTYGGRVAVQKNFDFGLSVFYAFDQSHAENDQGFTNLVDPPSTNAPAVYSTLVGGTPFKVPPGVVPPGINVFTGGKVVTYSQFPITDKYPSSAPYSLFNPYFITDAYGHTLDLTYDLTDDWTVKAITGVRTTEQVGMSNLPVSVSPVNPAAGLYLKSQTFSQEFQALYSTDNFHLTTGAIFFHEHVLNQIDSWFTGNCAILNAQPPFYATAGCVPGGAPTVGPYFSPLIAKPPAVDGLFSQTSTTRAYGIYGQGDYTPPILDDKVTITLGLRYTDDTKDGLRDISLGLPVHIGNHSHVARVDPAFTIKYNWTDDINTYVRYASGFRDGGANVRSETFNAYGPELLKSLEFGLKSTWLDRRLTVNAAVFHNILSGQQLDIQTEPQTNPSLINTFNYPEDIDINGVELEATAHPIPNLTISASFAYLDYPGLYPFGATKTNAGFLPQVMITPAGVIPSPATIAAHPDSTVYSLVWVGTPEYAGSLSVDYTIPEIVGGMDLMLHGDWAKNSPISTSPTYHTTAIGHGSYTIVPDFQPTFDQDILNLRVALRNIPMGPATGEIALWGKNVLGNLNGSFAFSGGPLGQEYLLPPATYGVELRVKF